MPKTVMRHKKENTEELPHREIDRLLSSSPYLKRIKIQVTIKGDIIILNGRVSLFHQKQNAQEVLRDWAKIAGMSISNQLEVK